MGKYMNRAARASLLGRVDRSAEEQVRQREAVAEAVKAHAEATRRVAALSAAANAGAAARREGKPIHPVPAEYPPGSAEAKAWQVGWRAENGRLGPRRAA